MPKTLAEESPDGRVFFAPGVLHKSPFAGDVAYVIALWAHIDGDIASILSRMLKSDIAVGTAMYLSLVGSGAQRGALDAAAKESLPEWQQLLLKAIGSVVEPSRNMRNHFAHRIWGHCSELTEAILLTHPKTIVKYNVSHRQRVEVLPDGRGVIRPTPLDDKEILVYRRADFDAAIEEAKRAQTLYRLFYAVLCDAGEGPKAQLLADPVLKLRLDQVANGASAEAKAILGIKAKEKRKN
ncbi:MAG: hypothetical protein U0S50_08840 [Sphingopyxis sp.]|jgi:hypothetical protein|uniref:hypothetical protein n=1 Tax=Sphingopyxis sp. TaxID=1908224 RepID=UPI002ABBE4B1|nr:hypothetical protein [Sphingopyxis sp.]MDZ3831906.1 hypothetical protein [Sphingopyxis sp.]